MPYIWDQEEHQYVNENKQPPTGTDNVGMKSGQTVGKVTAVGTWVELHKAASVAIAAGIVIVLAIVLNAAAGQVGSGGGTPQDRISSQMASDLVGLEASDATTVTSANVLPGTVQIWRDGSWSAEADVTYSDGTTWRTYVTDDTSGDVSTDTEYQEH